MGRKKANFFESIKSAIELIESKKSKLQNIYENWVEILLRLGNYSGYIGEVNFFIKCAIDKKDFDILQDIINKANSKSKQDIVLDNSYEIMKYFVEKMIGELKNNAENKKLRTFISNASGLLLPINEWAKNAFSKKLEEYNKAESQEEYNIIKKEFDECCKQLEAKNKENIEQRESVGSKWVEKIEFEKENFEPENDKKRKRSNTELEDNKEKLIVDGVENGKKLKVSSVIGLN